MTNLNISDKGREYLKIINQKGGNKMNNELIDKAAKEYAFNQTLKNASLNPAVRNAHIGGIKAGVEYALAQQSTPTEPITDTPPCPKQSAPIDPKRRQWG